mmetsp:Transcript_36657/g.78139  ORF Transcript_36657/g.78139 Transcript_36657/m.78139 type:complete len:136 (+) Transcript_36657:268-675(+)
MQIILRSVAPSIFVQLTQTAGGSESRAHELSYGTLDLFVGPKLAMLERRVDKRIIFCSFFMQNTLRIVAPSIFVQLTQTAGGSKSRAHELSYGTPGAFIGPKLAMLERRVDDASFFAHFLCKIRCGSWRHQYSSN